MAVPKQKKSKARTRQRRSQHDRITPKNVSWCEHCGARKLPHRVCLSCGTYKGRQVLAIVAR
jgi:large subunit ribosomal protein L32